MTEPSVDLSVLVCGIHNRRDTFLPRIQAQLFGQWEALTPVDRQRVEILVLTDNRQMVLGVKRNAMVGMAQGRYVQFVDDDDRVTDDFVSAMLTGTDSGADCIVFRAEVTLNGGPAKPCHYSISNGRDRNTSSAFYRLPNHLCAVRRELALQTPFPAVLCGEDSAYARALLPLLRTEHCIDRVLYYYDYSDATTATQREPSRPSSPVVDVVILSRADDPAGQRMTQQAVDTCHAGTDGIPVNILVVESGSGADYRHATTVRPPDGPFNYNAYANHAARLGSAAWVMVANNDLIFHDRWLPHLLAAGNDLVSPIAPGDKRQRGITTNTLGTVCGTHLSGWCYMIRRSLWERIGTLDTCVDFWCSDDVVIEQCAAAGVTPMIVPDAVVEHTTSATLRALTRAEYDNLTWRNVRIFNRKYGRDKFADDPRYRAFLARNPEPAEPVPA